MRLTTKNRRGRWTGEYRLGVVGGGPWRVVPWCGASKHNTLRAGQRAVPRCVCPRAVELVRMQLLERRMQWHGKLPVVKQERKREVDAVKRGSSYMRNAVQNVAVPELRWARCRTPEGLELLDRMAETSGSAHRVCTRRVQAMCFSCVEQQDCAIWALKAESPPGSWDGVYGGMTAAQRRNMIRQFGSGAK